HASYATLETAIDRRFRLFLGPLAGGPAWMASTFGRRWLNVHPKDVSPLQAIPAISPRPVLLFHGARDLLAHPSDAERLYAAAGSPKTLHRLPRSWHTSIHPNEQPEYHRQLADFFRRSFSAIDNQTL